MMSPSFEEQHDLIVVLDGVCVVCSSFARFVVYFNPGARLMWAQNPQTIEFLSLYGISYQDIMSSIAVFHKGCPYRGSDAFAIILKSMKWYLAMLGYFIMMFPRIIREYVYNFVARNRYAIFGKKNECSLPSPDLKAKFLHPI
jgi:predicted DCC family thiol-disulfide oxidoreductase YuxK